MRTQELIDAGMGPQAARLAALQAFGDLDLIERECRTIAVRGARERARRASMTGLLHDLRFAFRSLRKSPGLHLRLHPDARPRHRRQHRGVQHDPRRAPAAAALRRWRAAGLPPAAGAARRGAERAVLGAGAGATTGARSRALQSIVEYHSMPFILLGRGEPRRVQTGVVSANYFDVLGVKPLLGRGFRAGEDQTGAEPVLVLSYAFWQNRLGGDPGIVGRTFEMNDRIHTVIGVLPPVPQYPGRERHLHAGLVVSLPVVPVHDQHPDRAAAPPVRPAGADRDAGPGPVGARPVSPPRSGARTRRPIPAVEGSRSRRRRCTTS